MDKLNGNLIKLIDEIAIHSQLENYKIQVPTSNLLKYEGFNSTLIPVNIHERRGCVLKVIEIIIKLAPTSQVLRKIIPFEDLFQREIFIYEKVLPEFDLLQDDLYLHSTDFFKSYPKCFKTSLQNLDELLILENLSGHLQNYQLWDKNLPMTKNHIHLVLEEYGKFHALSFALRMHKPEKLEYFANNLEDIYLRIITKCGTADVIRNLCERVRISLSHDKSESTLVEKLIEFNGNLIEAMNDLVKGDSAGNYGVVCHGDNWCNNMLFKVNGNDGNSTPVKVKFLDWQLSRFGSPVLDISYFLYTSADKEMLDNLDDLLRIYHTSLSGFLQKLNCNVNDLFPYNVLQQHWKKFSKFGLGMAILVLHVMLMEKDETPYLKGENQSASDFIKSFEVVSKNNNSYVKRVTDLFKHFMENDFF